MDPTGKRPVSPDNEQRPAKRQQLLPGAAKASAGVIPGFSQSDVAQMLQLFAGNSGPSGAAADTTAPQQQLNLIAGLQQQQQLAASHGLPAALLTALSQPALPKQTPQLPHSSAALSSLLGLFQPGPLGPTPAVAGTPAAHLAAQPLQQLGLAAAAGVPAFPVQPMAAAGLGSDAFLAALQQQLLQQQQIQQQQRQQALATAQEQLLMEAAFAASLSAAASQLPPPQMLANTSAAAAPPAAAVGGIAPATAANLIQLLAAGAASVGSLMATVPNRQLLPPPGTGSGGHALQRRLLQQLQPSLLPTAHGAAAAINPQLPQQQQQPANLGGLQQFAAPILQAVSAAAAVAQPSHQLIALPAFNMVPQGLPAGYLQPGQQQGVATGVALPQQQALLQLQALGGQVPAQQQAQGNGQMDAQSAAALVQALTAAAHQLLNLPVLPSLPPQQAVSAPAALLAAAPAAPPAAPAAPFAAALAALSSPVLPSPQPAIVSPPLAAQPVAEVSAAVAVSQTAAQAAAAAAALPAPGIGPAAPAPAASAAAAVPPAVAPVGFMSLWLQDGRAALAALAALGAVAPPFAGAGGFAPGAGGAVGDAAGLVRFESVGGQSPVTSEETVESEESEHGEGSEGQGSSASRAK